MRARRMSRRSTNLGELQRDLETIAVGTGSVENVGQPRRPSRRDHLMELTLSGLARPFRRLLDDLSVYVNAQPEEPDPGSQLCLEARNAPREESLHTASSMASHLLESVGDHAALFCKSLEPPVAIIASCSCVRSMLEPSALIGWLLDPEIDGRERVGRVFALRYRELDQQVKVYIASGARDEVLERMQRIDEVEKQARRGGYDPVRSKKGKRIGIGQVTPAATDVIRDVLDQEVQYRLLSAVAHNQTWATRWLAFETHKIKETKFHSALAVKSLRPKTVALLSATTLEAIRCAVSPLATYRGWKTCGLEALMQRAYLDVLPYVASQA